MTANNKGKFGIVKNGYFQDENSREKWIPGRVIKSDGVIDILHTYKEDLPVPIRDLHYLNGNPLSAKLSEVLVAIDKIRQRDPDHLHIPSAKKNIVHVAKIVTSSLPKAASILNDALEILKKREVHKHWSIQDNHDFHLIIGTALAYIENLR